MINPFGPPLDASGSTSESDQGPAEAPVAGEPSTHEKRKTHVATAIQRKGASSLGTRATHRCPLPDEQGDAEDAANAWPRVVRRAVSTLLVAQPLPSRAHACLPPSLAY